MKLTIYRLPLVSSVIALMFSLLWLPANYQLALAQQTTPEQPPRSVSVSGSGQVNVRPDVAVIVVGVQTEAATASAALTQNSQQMIAVTTALTSTGILTDDIQTQVVQLQPHIPPPVAGQPQPAPQATTATTNTATNTVTTTQVTNSYIATNLIEVRVRDLAQLGQVLDRTIQSGGNQIQSIRFETSNPNQALDQARQAAWNDAKRKAEQLAQLAGVTLGSVLTVNEFSANPLASAQASAVSASAVAVPIAPGAQTITVNVQVTWSLSE
ncbi:MAG: SIMPL domain-containing protein [Chloroflexi bacterium]|nr:SIMPL domain-containing protein [Chloroflexota bacterium]